jgi:hypothetical protein
MMIKCTKLYDLEAYGSVSMLSSICVYKVMQRSWPLTSDLKNSRVLPIIMVIKNTKLYYPEANSSITILPTMFFY